MKKRFSAIYTAVTLLGMNSVCYASADVNVTDFNCMGNQVSISGTVSENCRLTLTVVKEGGNPSFDAVAIDEVRCDGEFEFDFGMPESDEVSDDYVIYLKASGGEEEFYDFSYASLAEQEILRESLENGDIVSLLDDESNTVAASCLGIDTELWNTFDASVKKKAESLVENSDDMVKAVNTAIYIASYNSESDSNKAVEVLGKLGFVWEETSFADMSSSRQNEINKQMLKTVSYNSEDEMKERFAEVNGLYEIGNAKKGEIEKVLDKYAEILGYENEAEYEEYKDLSSKSSANANIVDKLYSGNTYTVDGLMDIIDDAMTKKQSGGGSSGGGGGSSSKAPSVSVNNVAGVTAPSTEDNSEFEDKNVISFTDIDDTYWAKEYVYALVEKGVLNGYEDGTFRPEGTITREEFITMMVRAGDFPTTGVFCDFKDVDKNAWYYTYVASGYTMGLMNGVDSEYMGIGNNITRQDMAVILERAMQKRNIELTAGGSVNFADSNLISEYAVNSVNNLSAMGVINGKGDGFDPLGNLTRAEAAKVLYMVFGNR